MKILELYAMLMLAMIAISSVVIAVQLTRAVHHLTAIVPAILRYLSRENGIHVPHHFYHPPEELLVWEWRERSWRLRTSGVSPTEAGPPPERPGSYDGECVTTRRPGKTN